MADLRAPPGGTKETPPQPPVPAGAGPGAMAGLAPRAELGRMTSLGDSGYGVFTEGSLNGLTVMFNDLHSNNPLAVPPGAAANGSKPSSAGGGGGGMFSLAALEEEMDMAVEQTMKAEREVSLKGGPKGGGAKEREAAARKHSWFGSSKGRKEPVGGDGAKESHAEVKKAKVVIPAMKDVGKVGEEAPSYTKLFEAKKGLRHKIQANAREQEVEVSPAAALFAPDPEGGPRGREPEPSGREEGGLNLTNGAPLRGEGHGSGGPAAAAAGGGGSWERPLSERSAREGSGGPGMRTSSKGRESGSESSRDEEEEEEEEAPLALPVAPGGLYSAADVLRALKSNAFQLNAGGAGSSQGTRESGTKDGEKDRDEEYSDEDYDRAEATERLQAPSVPAGPHTDPSPAPGAGLGSGRRALDSSPARAPAAQAQPAPANGWPALGGDSGGVKAPPYRHVTAAAAGGGGGPFADGLRVPPPKGIYTKQFEEAAQGGSMPAFPMGPGTPPAGTAATSKAAGGVPFPKRPTIAPSTYTEAFSKGTVPNFPSIQETPLPPRRRSLFCGCFS